MIHILNRSVTVVTLFLICVLAYGQSAVIKGSVPGGELKEIRVTTYSDQITYHQIILNRTKISQNGEFVLDLGIKQTSLIFLDIEHYNFAIIIEPGEQYEILCDSITLNDEFRPFYNKENLPVQELNEPEPGVNKLIINFNQDYNEFLLSKFSGTYQVRNINVINDFKARTGEKFNSFNNTFLNEYIEYKIATLELTVAPSKKPFLFSLYLENKPILYSNPEFMTFFNDFFDKHVSPANTFIKREDLLSCINYQKDYFALMDTLGKDTLLRNEVIREMAFLKTMKEIFFNNAYIKNNVLDLIGQLESKSKFEEHRLIAKNLIFELTHLRNGYPAPFFELNDLEGNTFNLNDFRGKPLYIGFFTTWSYACLAEFELMKQHYDKYGGQISFITIALDKNPEIVLKLKADKGYDWKFLYNGIDFDLIYNYRIKTFPSFVFIDKDGNILQYPAYKPSEVISEQFDRVLKKQD